MPAAGQPSKFRIEPTAERLEAACAEAELGRSLLSCAAAADVSPQTFERWLARARDLHDGQRRAVGDVDYDPELLADFHERFEAARGRGVRLLEGRWDEHGEERSSTWTAWATKLERMHPQTFGKRDEVEHKHQVTFVIERPPRRDELEAGEGGVLEATAHRLELPAAPAAGGVPEQ